MKRVAGMFLAALALFAFNLYVRRRAPPPLGVACPQTGNELDATDGGSYFPGDLVHITGMGYSSDCDVVVKVTRPDVSVVKGDGTFAPGSDTVTTGLFGGLAYDYQLQATPALEGTYSVKVLGAVDTVLAHATFEDASNINMSAAPSPILASSSRVVAVDISNQGGKAFSNSDPNNIRCVKATFPVGFMPVSVVGVGTTRAGQSWRAQSRVRL